MESVESMPFRISFPPFESYVGILLFSKKKKKKDPSDDLVLVILKGNGPYSYLSGLLPVLVFLLKKQV
jgi:hypothetical protein